MYKKFILIFALAVLSWPVLHAHQLSAVDARSIASRFMKENRMGEVAAAQPAKALRHNAVTPQSCAYYVFNAQQNRGFVIVSGDDRTEPVLGYSDSGNFDPDNVPENMQAWLDQYVEEIAMLDEGVVTADRSSSNIGIKAHPTDVIQPLLSSQWAQGAPFYLQCPTYNGNYCVTGCVATAMAQIMYYHQWPSSTSQTIPGYTQSSNSMAGTTYPALTSTTFNWGAMKNYYSSSETSTSVTANAAVARLMRYCGQAVQMEYGVSSSNALRNSDVFVEYFRYSTKAQLLCRVDYSYSQWENFIIAELRSQRPVMYSGQKQASGHAFVCDGYDGNGYFHFNWGWRGSEDGYFLLTALNPKGGGIGSAVGNNGYMLGNSIIIGLEPNTVATSERNSTVRCWGIRVENSTNSATYTRSDSSEPFLIHVSSRLFNENVLSRTYELSWGVYNSTGFDRLQYYNNGTSFSLGPEEYTDAAPRTLLFGKDFDSGTYYLRPICRESGGSAWLPCRMSGLNYIKAVINGNTLTLTPVNRTINSSQTTTDGVTASIADFSAIKKVNRPLEVKVRVTKTDFTDNVPLYLWANNSLVGANSMSFNGGSSGYVTISYSPTSSGTNNLKITGDASANYVYCTGSVNIDPLTAGDLSYLITGGNLYYNFQTTDNYILLRFKLTNNLTSAYNDFIVAKLYKKNNATGIYDEVDERAIPINLSGSASTTGNFTFSKLEPGTYKVEFYYYNYDNLVWNLRSPTYYLYAKGDVNGDGAVTSADITALYDCILSGDTSNEGRCDVNNDGSITAADVTAVYDILLGT